MEKLMKFINKVIFVIEFIISIFGTYSLYQIVLYKNTANNIPIKHLIIFIISIIVLLGIIIYNYKNNKEKVEKVIISFLIPISMTYVFFMAPGYVPDEPAHIYKAYEISTGKLITEIKEDGSSTNEVPKYLRNNIELSLTTYSQYNMAVSEETDYDDVIEVESPAQAYPPILYAFSALGFLIGRAFKINVILAVYLARIFNLMVFLIIGYYSIKLIPFGKKILSVVLFLPMSLQQAASVSADCLLNAVSIFFIAYTLYLCNRQNGMKVYEKILYIIMSIIISISKIAYAPLVGISLLLFKNKGMKKKEKIIYITFVIIVSAICCLSWYLLSQKYQVTSTAKQFMEAYSVDATQQLNQIIKNPLIMFKVIGNSIYDGAYINGMIGNHLGWLNIEIPEIVSIMFIILLILSPFLDKNENETNKWEKLLLLAIIIGTYLLVVLALYLTWTTIGSNIVMGVQGRYFIPIIALPLLILCNKDRYIKFKHVNLILPIIITVLHVIAMSSIIEFFIK